MRATLSFVSTFAFCPLPFYFCLLLLPPPGRQRDARAAASVRDYLGEYGERDLFGRDRADVEADGRANLREQLFVEARLAQAREHDVRAPAAADHADVVGGRLEDGPHALLVLVVPARDDRDVDAPARADNSLERVSPVRRGDQFDVAPGEALARDEVLAVVHERDAVADHTRQSRERRADVARAADDDVRLRLDALE